jgi:hypothetical protein
MAFYILPDSGEEPRLVPLTGTAEQTEAIDAILPLAQRRIRVFDHDLSETGWNSPEREEVLTAFLLRSRLNRLDLLVRDPAWLEGRCPRLRGLQRRFSHLVSVHQCGEPAMHATDPMVIVDERHFVHRFHFEQAGAVAGVFQDGEARALASRFDALWQDSAPTLPPTTLGL